MTCISDKTEGTPTESKPSITYFGTRKIYRANLSRAVTLPALALMNCGIKPPVRVKVEVVKQNGEKYLKLSPIDSKGGEVI